jgi:hypothetical protein
MNGRAVAYWICTILIAFVFLSGGSATSSARRRSLRG